jgi:hypothetical protein
LGRASSTVRTPVHRRSVEHRLLVDEVAGDGQRRRLGGFPQNELERAALPGGQRQVDHRIPRVRRDVERLGRGQVLGDGEGGAVRHGARAALDANFPTDASAPLIPSSVIPQP